MHEVAALNTLDWLIVIGYLAGMIALSIWLGRGQEDVEDYYLGGNKLQWWAIGLSTMATQCSTNSFLGTPAFVGLGLAGGLVFLQTELALPLAMIFVMIFLLPFFRRANVISVYEYLEKRFGVECRTLLSVLFQISRAFGTGVTVYSVSVVLEAAFGLPLWASIVLIGVITVIYDTIGGMSAVVYSDVIQMVVLYTGVLLCTWYAISNAGGVRKVFDFYRSDTVTIQAPATIRTPEMPPSAEGPRATVTVDLSDKTQVAHLTGAEKKDIRLVGLKQRFHVLNLKQFGFKKGEDYSFWAMLIGFFFLYCSYYGCDQSQVQRELSSKNVDDTKLSLFANGAIRFFLACTLCLMGLAIAACLFSDLGRNGAFLHSILREPAKQNQMVIYFVLRYLPHGIIGLIVVAIFSAAMSSLDSSINSLSATTMRDIYERFIDSEPHPAMHLRMSRMLTVTWGAICTGTAFATPYIGKNVVIAVNKMGSLTYGPIFATFALAILTRRANSTGVFTGIIAGVTANLLVWRFTDWSWLWWNVIGFAGTALVGYLVSHLAAAPDPARLKGLVYEYGRSGGDDFGCRLNWPVYYGILLGFFCLFLAICHFIQQIPGWIA